MSGIVSSLNAEVDRLRAELAIAREIIAHAEEQSWRYEHLTATRDRARAFLERAALAPHSLEKSQ